MGGMGRFVVNEAYTGYSVKQVSGVHVYLAQRICYNSHWKYQYLIRQTLYSAVKLLIVHTSSTTNLKINLMRK